MARIPMNVDSVEVDPKEYPPNNGKEIPKVEAELVTPRAKRQSNLRNAIISAEITDMKHFLVYNCLIPFAKNAFMNTLSMMLFNQPWSNSGKSSNRSTGPRTYTGSTYWSGSSTGGQLRDISKDFLFETKAEALDVMEGLRNWSERAGVTTIADLCRIAGLTPEPGDADYGWFSLRSMRVQSYGNSFYIELPRARLLS